MHIPAYRCVLVRKPTIKTHHLWVKPTQDFTCMLSELIVVLSSLRIRIMRKLIFGIFIVVFTTSCTTPAVHVENDLTEKIADNDTTSYITYLSDKEETIYSVKRVWAVDTMMVRDTLSGELYPVSWETGEILFYDSFGRFCRINPL